MAAEMPDIDRTEGSGRAPGARPGFGSSGRLGFVLLGLCACLAWQSGRTADEVAAEPVAAATDLDALLPASATISDAELDAHRAKARIEVEKIVINDQDLNGVVSENTAINTVSGNNTISGDAFSSSSGFLSTVQNTGNNVLIQNATIVNIEVQP